MNPKFILTGLVLIFFSFLAQQAFAFNPSCNDISIDTYTIRIAEGKSTIISFNINNSASERFFIDSAKAFDFSTNFNTNTNGYDRTVLSQSNASINVNVTGRNFNENALEKGFIEVRGRFLGGKTCAFDEIKADFPVIVEKQGEIALSQPVNYCEGIGFIAPRELNISESGTFELTIDNQTNYRATIRLFIENGFVNPALISVPKQSKITETIFVSTGKEQAALNYSIGNGKCSFEKKTIINSSQEKTLAEKISMGTAIQEKEGNYELKAILQNTTGETIAGFLEINVPSAWKIQGNNSIELNAFEAKEAKFIITPDKPLQETIIGNIAFQSNDQEISKQIAFNPKKQENPITAISGTMLTFLGGSILLGILLILIIAFFLLAYYSRKQKKPIILITKPQEVKS